SRRQDAVRRRRGLRGARAPPRRAAAGRRRRHARALAPSRRRVDGSLLGAVRAARRHAASGGHRRRESLQRRAPHRRRGARYTSALATAGAALERSGLARLSEGAMCVFLPGFTGRDGQPVPLMVRKQDGGYTYATTDLAALRYRTQVLGARRVIYVVGTPQS